MNLRGENEKSSAFLVRLKCLTEGQRALGRWVDRLSVCMYVWVSVCARACVYMMPG